MKRILIILIICFPIILWAQKTIIHAGTLLDGKSKKAVSNRSIIIEDGKIVDVKSGYVNGDNDAKVIDLKMQPSCRDGLTCTFTCLDK